MRKKINIFVLALFLSNFLFFAVNLTPIKAVNLTTVYAKDANTTTDFSVSDANPQVKVYFTPATAVTTGSIIEVSYDTAFTGGASLVDADVVVTGTNITSSAESDFAAGYFRSTLTTSASVTTEITITIGDGAAAGLADLAAPSSSGNYSFTVVVDIGGTGTTIEYGAGLGYVGDDNDVTITAIVPPVIDLELFQTGTDTELTDPNACVLGPLSLNAVKTCVYDIGWATNLSAGVTVKIIADAQLNSGANDINVVSDGTVTAGFEEYGIRISDLGAGCTAAGSGTFNSADTAVPTAVTNFFTSSTVCNGTTAGQSAKHVEVTHKAAIDTSTVVGTYDQLVTYTAFTN